MNITKPIRLGFCNPSNPADSHKRCPGSMQQRETAFVCECECHLLPPPGADTADTAPESGLSAAPVGDHIPGRAAGFVHNLDEQTYHADRESLSVSGAKVLLKAPALFRWQQDHPVIKDVFDIGSAAHRVVLGIGPDICVCPFDDWRSKDAREMRDLARGKGEIPVLTADWTRVNDMAYELNSHKLASALFQEGKPEVSAYATDDATGVLRRSRFDWLHPNVLTDYKTTVSSDPLEIAGRYGAVKKWGYDAQAAWYTDLARDLGHPAEFFALVFQMKEPPYLVTVARIEERDLHDARERNRRALELFAECTAHDTWPGYLADDRCAVVSLTDRTYTEESAA